MTQLTLSRLGWVSVVAWAIGTTACGSGGSSSPTVAAINVSGISQPLLVGGSGQAVATATDAGGAVLVRSFTWASSNPAVATVTTSGTVTGVSAGTTTISASADGKTGSLMVSVNNPIPTVATITVTGISQPLLVGTHGQAIATATDAGGTVLTRTFTWATSNAAIATVGADGTVAAIAAGNATITANVDGKSGAITVAVNNVVPVVGTISPASVTAGAAAQTLTVLGSGFISSSVVRWNGAGLPTTFGSSMRLTAQLPAGNIAAATAAQVTVFSPAPGGGSSDAQTFTVSAAGSNPVPAITALGPTSIAAGGAAFTLTVTGSNFISTSTVQWNGSTRPTTFVSSTQLLAQIGAADIASAVTVAITVLNPTPGGGTAAPRSFTAFTSLPTLTYAQLPVALAAHIDTMISADAENAAVSITSPGLPRGSSASFAVMPLSAVNGGIAAARRAAIAASRRITVARLSASGNCPLVVPPQPAVNAAGLPFAMVTYTFTLANCTDDAYNSKNGVVTLSAPNSGSSALDYDITAVNFDARVGDSTFTIDLLINAVDSVRNPSLGLVNEWLTESQKLDETGVQFGHLVDTVSLHTVYTYPPASGQLLYNVRMFPGTIIMDQTTIYVIAPGNNFGVSGTFTVVTTTLTPLQFDPTCQSDIQYIGGVLQSVVAGRTETTTYHACNTAPTIQ